MVVECMLWFCMGPLMVGCCGRNVKFRSIVSCMCLFDSTGGIVLSGSRFDVG